MNVIQIIRIYKITFPNEIDENVFMSKCKRFAFFEN